MAVSPSPSPLTPSSTPLFPELLAAVRASRRAALAAKALQSSLLAKAKDAAAISKVDSSPVTVADFSVQVRP
jgi:3'-phosphoadenosine 5'-phosphosulfate (PAPS) 3'-phosphatase